MWKNTSWGSLLIVSGWRTHAEKLRQYRSSLVIIAQHSIPQKALDPYMGG